MIHQSHCWAYIQEKNIILKAICIPLHCSTLDNSQDIEEAAVYREMNGSTICSTSIQQNATWPHRRGIADAPIRSESQSLGLREQNQN